MQRKRILCVDDDDNYLDLYRAWVGGRLGHDVLTALSAKEALQIIRSQHFDLILADISMPDMDGIQLLHSLITYDPTLKVVMVSGFSTADIAATAFKAGAFDYVTKPIDFDQLDGLLDRVLPNNKVFIVHGHDEAAKESVARFISKLKLHPIILQEQPTSGRTIIEQFEYYSHVGFAVVLLTPDDVCIPYGKAKEKKGRARQNVIFELGYFVGLLGRDKVCALYKEGIEIPSDYHGVLYIPLDSGGAWRTALARELRQAGMDIDVTKV